MTNHTQTMQARKFCAHYHEDFLGKYVGIYSVDM